MFVFSTALTNPLVRSQLTVGKSTASHATPAGKSPFHIWAACPAPPALTSIFHLSWQLPQLEEGQRECWLQCYFVLQPGGALRQNGLCRVYYLDMLIERWIVKSSCVKWWHGAEKQTQSEKQVLTQEAKLEIILYYHFQEIQQIKIKKKNQGSLNSSQNHSTP